MISRSELDRSPEYTNRANDTQILEKVESSINRVVKTLEGPLRLIPGVASRVAGEDMFDICPNEWTTFYPANGGKLFADSDRMQELALRVMKEKYGFSEDVTGRVEVKNYTMGRSTETIHYPSSTIKGLEFVRMKHFDTDTAHVYRVCWSVGRPSNFAKDPSNLRRLTDPKYPNLWG